MSMCAMKYQGVEVADGVKLPILRQIQRPEGLTPVPWSPAAVDLERHAQRIARRLRHRQLDIVVDRLLQDLKL